MEIEEQRAWRAIQRDADAADAFVTAELQKIAEIDEYMEMEEDPLSSEASQHSDATQDAEESFASTVSP